MPSWLYRAYEEYITSDGPWAATGVLSLNGTAQLTLAVTFAANGTLALTGTAGLTAQILFGANGVMALVGAADLQTGKKASVLSGCGGPLAADCDSWLLKPFQRS